MEGRPRLQLRRRVRCRAAPIERLVHGRQRNTTADGERTAATAGRVVDQPVARDHACAAIGAKGLARKHFVANQVTDDSAAIAEEVTVRRRRRHDAPAVHERAAVGNTGLGTVRIARHGEGRDGTARREIAHRHAFQSARVQAVTHKRPAEVASAIGTAIGCDEGGRVQVDFAAMIPDGARSARGLRPSLLPTGDPDGSQAAGGGVEAQSFAQRERADADSRRQLPEHRPVGRREAQERLLPQPDAFPRRSIADRGHQHSVSAEILTPGLHSLQCLLGRQFPHEGTVDGVEGVQCGHPGSKYAVVHRHETFAFTFLQASLPEQASGVGVERLDQIGLGSRCVSTLVSDAAVPQQDAPGGGERQAELGEGVGSGDPQRLERSFDQGVIHAGIVARRAPPAMTPIARAGWPSASDPGPDAVHLDKLEIADAGRGKRCSQGGSGDGCTAPGGFGGLANVGQPTRAQHTYQLRPAGRLLGQRGQVPDDQIAQ